MVTTYTVKIIAQKEDIDACPAFAVDHYLWTCLRHPQTEGRMGYIPGEGLFLRMTSREADPLRNLHHHGDMVCKDSAMEAFFAFPKDGMPPADDALYLNLEFNANAALYAAYGYGRKERCQIDLQDAEATGLRAWVEPDRWTAELVVPQSLLSRIFAIDAFEESDVFYCNFYKISEDPRIEHYASFSPIGSETPNFHLPRFFGRAEITGNG